MVPPSGATIWNEWGDELFARARDLHKPVLLSLTATWCHACHRMDDETWDDPGVASAVTRATIPVRVDADARPDVYGRYHLGGLPTVALLTSDGAFVRGGTFLSPPQFFAFLQAALADWRADRLPAPRLPAPASPTTDLVGDVIARLLRRVDPEHGGFGVAPKQPEVQALHLLLERWRSSREAALERVIRGALDAIVSHLTDPRDGGFFRYAAAADWSEPHTEKVALDQALITGLLLEAGCALGESSYIMSARAALAHARRRLADAEGRVFASAAADPAYYAGANGGEEMPAVDRRRFAAAGAAMVSAGWLASMVTGVWPPFQPEFRRAAAAGAVPVRLDEPGDVAGLLMDQALALKATLIEYRLTGSRALLQWALRAADWSIRHLWDEGAGAFRASVDNEVDLPPVFPLVGNGEMGLALIDVAAHTGRREYRRYAERAVESLGSRAVTSPVGAAVALVSQRLREVPAEVVLKGVAGGQRERELARVALAGLGTATIVRWDDENRASAAVRLGERWLEPVEEPRTLVQSLIRLGIAHCGILDFIWQETGSSVEEDDDAVG
jgi:hypothetical protein